MVKDYVVFDLETTGLSPDKDTIIEIGALKVIQGKVVDRFSEFINPHQKLTQQISELTGITEICGRGEKSAGGCGRFCRFLRRLCGCRS